MSDDIVDRPLLELGFSRPALVVERVEDRKERVAFVAKVYRLLNHVGDYLSSVVGLDCDWLQTARISSRVAWPPMFLAILDLPAGVPLE